MKKYQVYMCYEGLERIWIVWNTELEVEHSTHYTYESALGAESVLNCCHLQRINNNVPTR